MAFPTIPAKTAAKIIDISVELFDPDPTRQTVIDGDETQGVIFSVPVELNDDSLEVKTGNLVPHITAGQISALQDFMASLRIQANDEFLP